MSSIDSVLAFNREFVAAKGYEKHITDKFPDKKLAVLSCMDTRLSVLLQEALGLRNGDAKVIKNAGAVIPSPWDSAMRSLIVAVYELGVDERTDVDLDAWLEGFHDTEKSVRSTVAAIVNHLLSPEWFRDEIKEDIAAMAKRYGL